MVLVPCAGSPLNIAFVHSSFLLRFKVTCRCFVDGDVGQTRRFLLLVLLLWRCSGEQKMDVIRRPYVMKSIRFRGPSDLLHVVDLNSLPVAAQPHETMLPHKDRSDLKNHNP